MLIVLRSVDIVGSGINGPSFGGSDSGYDLGAGGPDMGVSGPSMMGSHVGGKLFRLRELQSTCGLQSTITMTVLNKCET
ncbi:hypothetical protein DPMN_059750 [Dreissena polymorpha]|uniref:Uncharacterized protein n=1 Tax=Dreissena polymorpha TaxID=45954 RepID=A0A9D4C417_DREPO|nr:hypothetical protein DPMN_059750 [Dreissena polymorpha]